MGDVAWTLDLQRRGNPDPCEACGHDYHIDHDTVMEDPPIAVCSECGQKCPLRIIQPPFPDSTELIVSDSIEFMLENFRDTVRNFRAVWVKSTEKDRIELMERMKGEDMGRVFIDAIMGEPTAAEEAEGWCRDCRGTGRLRDDSTCRRCGGMGHP